MLYLSHSLLNIQLIELCLFTGFRVTNTISVPLKVFFSLPFPSNSPPTPTMCKSIFEPSRRLKSIYGHQVHVQVELNCACALCRRRQSQKMLIWGTSSGKIASCNGRQKASSFAKEEMTCKETTVERVFVHRHFQISHASLLHSEILKFVPFIFAI